jgi:hypothetical protein
MCGVNRAEGEEVLFNLHALLYFGLLDLAFKDGFNVQ